MDKVRRLAELVLERHPDSFSSDFEKNKKALVELAEIPSKQLRNHIAGYIAKSLQEESAAEDEEPIGEAAAE